MSLISVGSDLAQHVFAVHGVNEAARRLGKPQAEQSTSATHLHGFGFHASFNAGQMTRPTRLAGLPKNTQAGATNPAYLAVVEEWLGDPWLQQNTGSRGDLSR